MSIPEYLMWRIAHQIFQRRPWQLDQGERALVHGQAAREQRVITAAIAAPEAALVRADADVVRAAIAAMADGFPDRETFQTDLARGGLDEEGLYQAIATELRAGLVLDQIGASAVVDEPDVYAYYARQRARMVSPERRAVRHILVTINDDYPENSRSSAQRRLDELVDALASGADFGALAMRYSECPSAMNGGSLGQVSRRDIYPELAAVLFTLEPGEVRAVESPLGFHLLRCDAVISAQPISYEAAAPAIRRKLESSARDRVLREWLAGYGRYKAAGDKNASGGMAG